MSTASPSSPVSSAFAERLILTDRPTAVRWRILTWIVVASVVAYLLRFNLSVAGPSMMRDLGLTEAQLGLVLGAFAWCYGLFQGPAGLIGERVGPHRLMTAVFIAWFATTACDRLSVGLGPRLGCRICAVGGLVCCARLFVAGTLVSDPAVSVALLSVGFGCIQFVDGTYWAATMRIAGPQTQSATGILKTGGNVVGGIGAVIVPMLATSFGWAIAVASGAAFAIAAAALWCAVRPDLALQDRAQEHCPDVLTELANPRQTSGG